VDGDIDRAAGFDLCHSAGYELVLCFCADIDVSRDLRATAFVHDVGGDFCVANYDCVLLAGTDGCAIASECLINCGRMLATLPL
jgi:hypothetical protein